MCFRLERNKTCQFLIGNVYQFTKELIEKCIAAMCQFLIGNVYRGKVDGRKMWKLCQFLIGNVYRK